MDIRKYKVVKLLTCACLIGLCFWQGYLAILAYQFTLLFQDMNLEQGLAVFVTCSQPFIWLFIIATFLLTIDIYKRDDFLILNSFGIFLALTAGTIIIQILMVLGGYAPIFELGASN